jgi:uncharacterized protein (DUF1330 family)
MKLRVKAVVEVEIKDLEAAVSYASSIKQALQQHGDVTDWAEKVLYK